MRCRTRRLALLTLAIICFPVLQRTHASSPQITSAVYWHRIARELVQGEALSPPRAARVYAYLSLAQQQALVSFGRSPNFGEADRKALLERVVSAASAAVLVGLF